MLQQTYIRKPARRSGKHTFYRTWLLKLLISLRAYKRSC